MRSDLATRFLAQLTAKSRRGATGTNATNLAEAALNNAIALSLPVYKTVELHAENSLTLNPAIPRRAPQLPNIAVA
jgi:hypothetical protein